MTAVEVNRLSRTFRTRRARSDSAIVPALAGVDLTVEVGEVLGLLGPNGAGKTTLCRILSTVLLPTSGQAQVLGHDVVRDAAAVRRSIGVVFGGDRGLYGRLSARQNLSFWAALYGLRTAEARHRVAQLLERVGLTDRADERTDRFSRGMKQRLHLARGLIADPPVLILDEPTVGMDPVATHEFRVLVEELRRDGRTILLTTHDMAEAEAVCDRVTLVDRGRVLLTGRPSEIGALGVSVEHVRMRGLPDTVRDAIAQLPSVVAVHHGTDDVTDVEIEGAAATREVLGLAVRAGVTDLTTRRPNLEEVYLRIIGRRGMAVER